MGVGVQRHTTAALSPGKKPGEWASGSVWTGAENLKPTGIWSTDRSARGESVYRVSCPTPNLVVYKNNEVDGYIAMVTYLFSEKGFCGWS